MKYLKNKGFIPKSYIEDRENNEVKSNKRAIVLLVIINLIILPLNLNKIKLFSNNSDELNKLENIDLIKGINKEILIRWINVSNDSIEKFKVENDIGEFTIVNRDTAYKLEELGFTIKEITEINENLIVKVKLGDL